MVETTQADRDAAVKWAYAEDSESAMQEAFAVHREAEAARIVAWLRHGEVQNFGSGFRSADRLAKAIESGEHSVPPAK